MGAYDDLKASDQDIAEMAGSDPTRALLALLGNATLAGAEAQSDGRPHEPVLRKNGWSIAVETPQGVAGLWSCWLDNRFYLGYPNGLSVPDDLIMEVLGVETARPVRNVLGCAVGDWNYKGQFKDPDKPVVKNGIGQIVAYREETPRQWAKFYGPPLPEGSGRVWIDHSDFDSNGYHFPLVRADRLDSAYCGHDESMSIATFPFSFHSEYAPEAPTAAPSAIRPYRDKFLALLGRVASLMGGAQAVHIDYGFVLVPEQLAALGYTLPSHLSQPRDLLLARKGDEMLALKRGNSMVPWASIRRLPWSGPLTETDLLELLTF